MSPEPLHGTGATASGGALPAIEALAVLPIYLKLAGRRALLAGGSLPAVWKGQLLVAAGANVLVCDASPCPEMTDFARQTGGAAKIAARPWDAGDLVDCAIAIGALEGSEAIRFRDAARRAGVPVNIIDVPDLCDFQFGTIINRSPLLIGISTDGAAPVLGQALRTRIEALLPRTLQAWAQAAKEWRADLKGRHLGFAARRRYWEAFADLALDGSGRVPSEADRAACLGYAVNVDAKRQGSLVLLGMGPGDPDLLTLGAVRALQSVDTMVHDRDVTAQSLSLGRREAIRRMSSPDDAITAADVSKQVEEGAIIAWVGAGDPASSGRWSTRQKLLGELGTPFVIVRGFPAANPRGSDQA